MAFLFVMFLTFSINFIFKYDDQPYFSEICSFCSNNYCGPDKCQCMVKACIEATSPHFTITHVSSLSLYTAGAPVAQWVKRWPTDLADRVRSSLEVKSSQP